MKKITFLVMALLASVFMNAQYANMAIVGDGAGGWPGADGVTDNNQMTSTDGVHWTFDNLVTHVGSVKFRTGNHWNPSTDNWGAPAGGAFPNGVAVVNSTTNITTPAGIYDVTFNSTTLEYTFTVQNLYAAVSIIGTGLDGIATGTDLDLFTADGIIYTSTDIHLVSGTVKFRQDHADTISWGNAAFPTGVATQGGANIVIPGTLVMNVTFNKTTGAYTFSAPTIAIVGSATPQGWPVDPQIDAHVLSSTDGISYTLNSITLVDGAAKFREENSWSVQWGSDTNPGSFPTGTGVGTNGNDIPVTAGTYSVTLNRTTGAYAFADPIAAVATLTKDAFKVYPNPTTGVWNFTTATGSIDTIMITDLTGKTVLTAAPKNSVAGIDASGLASGVYFAKVSVAGTVKTMKLIKN